MFNDAAIRHMTDVEYLHYASLGIIPGIDPAGVDAFVADCLAYKNLHYARKQLVELKQKHATELDKRLSLMVL